MHARAMSLPGESDLAGLRALDAKCADPLSVQSKRTVAQLSKLPLAHREMYLHNCAALDCADVVRCLLAAGVSVEARDEGPEARTALHVCVICGDHERTLKVLLAAGADLEARALKRNATALHFAAQTGRPRCLELLLAAGADANAVDWLGNNSLMKLATETHSAECVRAVVQALLPVTDLQHRSAQGHTILHMCTSSASEELFEMVLPAMSDVDVRTTQAVHPTAGVVRSPFNSTALHMACQRGQQPMAKALLKRGASRMARDSGQSTPLHHAALCGHLSCVVLLIGQPGRRKLSPEEVNATDAIRSSALHIAAFQGYDKVCGVLIAAGARLDAKTSDGETPHTLARRKHPTNAPLLALLSGQGPAVLPGTVCDHCGKTAEQASVHSLKSCGGCQAARFCGAACIAAAWPGHKKACKERRAENVAKSSKQLLEPPSA